MEDFLRAMWGGPGHFRFFVQPLMAVALGIHFGIRDARQGKPPYGVTLVSRSVALTTKLRELVKAVAFPLFLALVMSAVFQAIIRHSIRPWLVLAYAVLFVVVPFVTARGFTNRLYVRLRKRQTRTPVEV